MKLPTPPADRPQNERSLWTAQSVLRVCHKLASGVSMKAACNSEGHHHDRTVWEENARRGKDPFYSWMLACFDLAEADAVSSVEGSLFREAVDGDARAMALFLKHRSEAYKEEKTAVVSGGSVNVTIQNLLALVGSEDVTPASLVGAGYKVAEPEPLAIEQDDNILDAEPEAPKKYAFRRRTAKEE